MTSNENKSIKIEKDLNTNKTQLEEQADKADFNLKPN